MFQIDHDFYTIKKQKRESLEINYRQAYQAYFNANWQEA
jgi:hypothetical protein